MVRVVRYREKDLPAFRQFVRNAFHKKYILSDPKHLAWQFSRGALYCAKAGKKIVGFFGYVDLPYKVYRRSQKVRVVMNLFIDERYRVFGFGSVLMKKVLHTALPVLVAGYRPAAMKGFTHYKKGWREGVLQRYMAATKGAVRISVKDLAVSAPRSFSKKEIDALWKRVRMRYPVTVERTFPYLSWRFFKHPFLRYRYYAARRDGVLVGLLAWREDGMGTYRTARIVDCIADTDAVPILFSSVLKEAQHRRIRQADFLVSHRAYAAGLAKAGFVNVRGTHFEKFPLLLSPVAHKRHEINVAYTFRAPLRDCYFTKAEGDQDRYNPHSHAPSQ